jgi:hypothetical protein
MDDYSDHNPFVVRQRTVTESTGRHSVHEEIDLEDVDPIELPSYSSPPIKGGRRSSACAAVLAPPDWWFRLSRNQRRAFACIAGTTFCALFLAVSAGLTSGWREWSPSSSTSLSAPGPQLPGPGPAGSEGDLCSWSQLYLPRGVQPSFYDLKLATNMSAPYLVSGFVEIAVQVAAQTRCIVLHAGAGVSIASAVLAKEDGGALMGGQRAASCLACADAASQLGPCRGGAAALRERASGCARHLPAGRPAGTAPARAAARRGGRPRPRPRCRHPRRQGGREQQQLRAGHPAVRAAAARLGPPGPGLQLPSAGGAGRLLQELLQGWVAPRLGKVPPCRALSRVRPPGGSSASARRRRRRRQHSPAAPQPAGW